MSLDTALMRVAALRSWAGLVEASPGGSLAPGGTLTTGGRDLATVGDGDHAGHDGHGGAGRNGSRQAIGITPAKALPDRRPLSLSGSGFSAGGFVDVALDGTSLGLLPADAAGRSCTCAGRAASARTAGSPG